MSTKKELVEKVQQGSRMIGNRALLTNEKSQGILTSPHISIASMRTKHYNIFDIQVN
jgi:hypothetical protein